MKLRTISAVLACLTVFAALEFVATQAAKAGWPAYALASPTRAYTLDMLFARLSVGALATFAGGAVASSIDRGKQRTALMSGVGLLVLSVVWHIKIWDQYPVWYHLCWFGCIVPSAMLGGMMVSGKATR